MSPPPQPNPIDQALFRSLPYPLYVVDGDMVVRQENLRAAELGKNRERGVGLPEEVRNVVKEAMAENHDSGRSASGGPVLLSNGQIFRPQLFRLPGIFDGQDGWAVLLVDGIGADGIGGDGNEEARSKTLRTLSHEVRTPLTSIRLSLLLLLEEKIGKLNPAQRELLEMSRDECEHMLVMMQTQLELMRRQFGTKTIT